MRENYGHSDSLADLMWQTSRRWAGLA